MDSAELSKRFGTVGDCWKTLNEATVTSLRPSAGVYAIRISGGEKVGRLKGESDIVYVGSSGNVTQRLKAHLYPRDDLEDVGWHLALVGQHTALEFCVWECDDHSQRERDLLWEYFLSHYELPPANSRLPEPSDLDKARIHLLQIPLAERERVLRESQELMDSHQQSIGRT